MLCRGNFASGAFPSDVTVAIWSNNEYHDGVLCGVPAEERRKQHGCRAAIEPQPALLAPDRSA